MKIIPTLLKQELQRETQTIATLFTVTRRDGMVYRYTDHDEDIVLNPNTEQQIVFSGAIGYTPTAIESNSALSVDNLEIQGAITSETITQKDLTAGLWDYAEVRIELIDYTQPEVGSIVQRFGRLGEIKLDRGAFTAEIRGLTQNVQQSIGSVYAPSCAADLYNAECKVNKDLFTVLGQVSGLVSTIAFDTTVIDVDDFYEFGLIEFTSGKNEGIKVEVKRLEGSRVTLQERLPNPPELGDAFKLSQGCNKSLARCQQFNNVINFRGFPSVPGQDYQLSGKKKQ